MATTDEEHQAFEADWWGTCINTFSEEAKQITYAHRMGLINIPDPYTGRWPQYDLKGLSVLDIGGGPTSMLLKSVNCAGSWVVDPCPYPEWIGTRYTSAGIRQWQGPGERFRTELRFDEVWIYNVLQHVEDPEQVIATAKLHAPRLRMFEWVNTPPMLGHPHMLTKANLDAWIGNGANGTVQYVDENSAVGEAYFGEFVL